MSARRAERKVPPPKSPLWFVRLDYVARFIVKAKHGLM
jgi:hypothetical protein